MTAAQSRLERLASYLQADPDNVNLLRDMAKEALSERLYPQAIEALNRLEALGQHDANDAAAKLFAQVRAGQIDQACDYARAARQAWPDDEAVRLEGARALFHARQYQETIDWVQSAPFTDAALAQMAGDVLLQSMWHLGELEQACQIGAQILAQWPDNPVLCSIYSALLYDNDDMNQAFEYAKRAYTVSPAHAYQALHVLASERLLRQDLPGAMRFVELAQGQRQDDGRVWLIKGSVEMIAGQTDQALGSLKAALQAYPNHPGSYLALAWLQLTQKLFDEAAATVQQAIAVSPAFAESHGTLATILWLQGDADGAKASIRRAQLLDKDSYAAKYAQALMDGAAPEQIQELGKQVLIRAGLS